MGLRNRMDIERIQAKVSAGTYLYSRHADNERKLDHLTFRHVKDAILSGAILEQYPDTGRGETCLVVGISGNTPIHVVCGWHGEKIVFVTVYIPRPPKFTDPWTRAR
jgi:hypothetical protein